MIGQQLIGLPVDQIPTPALILDIEALDRNLATMSEYLTKVKTNIRPHAKTHKTPAIAHRQIQAGAIGICCATVGEAEVMVYAGIKDIMIANEVVGEGSIRRVVNLARHARIMVIIDDLTNVAELSAAARHYGANLDVLADLDVGLGRCGARSLERLTELATAVDQAPGLTLRGVFGYEGQVQFIADRAERTRLGRAANELLVRGAQTVAGLGLNVEIVSAAGTGTYDIAAEVPGITEIQAGSYIFMDAAYQKLGLPFEQALTVAGTVVSRPFPELVILDVGLKAISPERFDPLVQGYGGQLEVKSLSEEHALTRTTADVELCPGDRLQLIPSHCCTTVNLYDYLYVTRQGFIEAIWPVAARRA